MSDFPGLFEKSKHLIDNARKGLGVIANLAGMRKFYITYRDREPAIVQSGIGQLGSMQENGIVQS